MRVLGASVSGPGHLRRNEPNQDAWSGRASKSWAWAAVADGMGSKPSGRQGAHAAVAAAGAAWRLWSRGDGAAVTDFARLCEVIWRINLGRTPPEEACTTLLFVGTDPRGVLVAQLGDGLISVCGPDGHRRLTPDRTSFGNFTVAMGAPHRLADWTLHYLPNTVPGTTFLLASDGIADDLDSDRVAPMMARIVKEFGGAARPRLRLQRALRDWPVPHHLDDKTIALVWNPES